MNRLSAGTAELARRYCVWLWADGAWTGVQRVGGGLAAVGFAGGICLAAPIVLVPLAGALLLAAWHAHDPEAEAEDADEDDGEEAAGPDFLTELHALMASTDRLHLAQIAEHLYGTRNATPQVREECAALGVTITDSVRIKGRQPAVSTGLYRKHLPPLSGPSESGDVVAVPAGQEELQLQLQAGREGFVVLPDPAGNPHRHEVRWVADLVRKAS